MIITVNVIDENLVVEVDGVETTYITRLDYETAYPDRSEDWDGLEQGIVAKNTPLTDPVEILSKWRAERAAAVEAIEVTYNATVYQGDETSQDRMSRTINALPDTATTINWTAKDNSVHALNKIDLQLILLDAGTQQAALWNVGRPV